MSIMKSSLHNLPSNIIKYMDSSDNNFFLSYSWFVNFIETVSKPMKVESNFFYEDEAESPVILPLMFTNEHYLRVIKSLTNYYSPIFSILNIKSNSRQNKENFFTHLKKQLPVWDIMELRPLDFEECNYILTQLSLANLPAVSFFCFGNWYLDVNGRSFNEYFSSLSSQMKNTVTRKAKKFFQLEGAHINIISSMQDFNEGIIAYQQVYQSSWKVEEPFPEFMPGLMKLAASVEGLRLGIAYLEDKAIAAQLWIVADKTAYIFKLAYDENYKQYSAGTILTTKLMEYVIDVDKVEVIDYLCGDDAYKKDWMSSRRERWGILIFNTSTARGLIEYTKEMTKSYIKRLMAILGKTTTNQN